MMNLLRRLPQRTRRELANSCQLAWVVGAEIAAVLAMWTALRTNTDLVIWSSMIAVALRGLWAVAAWLAFQGLLRVWSRAFPRWSVY